VQDRRDAEKAEALDRAIEYEDAEATVETCEIEDVGREPDDVVFSTRADTAPASRPAKRTCESCFHWRKPPGRGKRKFVCQCSTSPRGNQPTGAAESCDYYVRDPAHQS